jgi:hypothetical protein
MHVRLYVKASHIGIIKFPVYKNMICANICRKLGIKYGDMSLMNSGLSLLTIYTLPPTPKPSISYPSSVYNTFSFSVFSGIFK